MAQASIRLTNSIRERIGERVLKYKYDQNGTVKEVSAEVASLATAAYNTLYTEKQRTLIDSLPNGWMPESDQIGVKFGFEVTQLSFNGEPSDFARTWDDKKLIKSYLPNIREVKKRLACNSERYRHGSTIDLVLDHNHDLTSRFNKVQRRVTDFLDSYKKDKLSIKTTLNSFTTAKKLMDEWPEVKPFVLQVLGNTSAPVQSTALAISRAELNEKFGLPVPA